MNIADEFLGLIDDAFVDAGRDLDLSREEVAAYAAERADHLSAIVHEPGFSEAVIAERDNIAMKLGLEVSENAHAADHRVLGWIGGALRIAAIALA